jgi:AAHS family benzoate transporter-like MFS transporter
MTSTVIRSEDRTGRRLAALVVSLCWLVVLFDGFDLFVYGSVLPRMLADENFALTAAQAGNLGSYATFGMLIGALTAGMATDRIGRKKVVIGCTVMFSLASAASALASTPGVFGAARFVAGLGLGGLLPTVITLVAEYAPRGRRNLFIGLLMTAHQAGGILASYLALWLLDSIGWRGMFWVGSAPLLLAIPLVIVLLPESLGFLLVRGRTAEARRLAERYRVDLPETRKEASGGISGLFRDGMALRTPLFWATSFCGLLLVYGMSQWLPTMMRASGYDLGSALQFNIVINLGGIVGMLVAGRIADRFGATRVAVAWFALSAAGLHLMGLHMPSLALTFLVVFLTGLVLFSAQTMVYAAVSHRFGDADRATAIGWTSGMGRFGAVFGPWAGGQLMASHHQGWGFTLYAGTAATAAILVALAGLGGQQRS